MNENISREDDDGEDEWGKGGLRTNVLEGADGSVRLWCVTIHNCIVIRCTV
jgi:hypothetical protein